MPSNKVRTRFAPPPSLRWHLSQRERPWQRDGVCVDCQGLPLWGSWQSRQALTERARTLPVCSSPFLHGCMILSRIDKTAQNKYNKT